MKRIILSLFLFSLVFVNAEITPHEAVSIAGEKLSDVGRNTDVYAESLGGNLLKFQKLFMGAVGFVSLGWWTGEGELDFVNFLFFILLFMMLYSIVGFGTNKFNFGIAFIITLLVFMGIDKETLKLIFLDYGAMGITITIVLPILILLTFTFRIYQKAYEGKSETSPFYAEMFNLVFLIFFGVFFIRHSVNEEGIIRIMRYFSGWILIGFGISQTVFYKIFARFLHIQKIDDRKSKMNIRKMKDNALNAIRDAELESYKKTD